MMTATTTTDADNSTNARDSYLDRAWNAHADSDPFHLREAVSRTQLTPHIIDVALSEPDLAAQLLTNPQLPSFALERVLTDTAGVPTFIRDLARTHAHAPYHLIADDDALAVRHAHVPAGRIHALAQSWQSLDPLVAGGLVSSPHLPSDVLDDIVASAPLRLRSGTLLNPNLAPEPGMALVELLDREHEHEHWGSHLYADNPNADPAWLAGILDSDDRLLVHRGAAHPHTPPEALYHYCSHLPFGRRFLDLTALLANPNATPALLTLLGDQLRSVDAPTSQLTLALHPNTPRPVLDPLYWHASDTFSQLLLLRRWSATVLEAQVGFRLFPTWTGTLGELFDVATGVLTPVSTVA